VSALSNSPASRNPPILCYVTDRRSLSLATPGDARPALARTIAAILTAGIDWVQIREKDLSAKDMAALTREALLHLATDFEGRSVAATRIVVNDRVDVALAERVGGAHLGENGLPVSDVRRLIETHTSRKDFQVGVSCHSLEAAQSAANDGASYLFFGPVFPTPSKAAFGAPQGVERLAEVCRSVSIPVLAIGGVTLENAAACFAAGAAGIAAIRLFQDSPDPTATIRALRQSSSAGGIL
jgi:thiamine-phosphate pyrophosphorylase